MVAVVIPCFNYGAYLEDAVASVERQTLTGTEIIVVDDGSTDEDTVKVIAALEDAKRVLVVRQVNKGLSAARNAGIRVSRARYICCLDADDRLRATYLERTVEVLESRPDVGVAYSWVRLFGDTEGMWRTAELDPRLLILRNTIPSQAVFRRALWTEAGEFNEAMDIGYEDWEFWLRIGKLGYRGAAIEQPLIEHRKHGRTMTDRARDRHDHLLSEYIRPHDSITRVRLRTPSFVEPADAFQNIPVTERTGDNPRLPRAYQRAAERARLGRHTD